jgi:hypothetical protein
LTTVIVNIVVSAVAVLLDDPKAIVVYAVSTMIADPVAVAVITQ